MLEGISLHCFISYNSLLTLSFFNLRVGVFTKSPPNHKRFYFNIYIYIYTLIETVNQWASNDLCIMVSPTIKVTTMYLRNIAKD